MARGYVEIIPSTTVIQKKKMSNEICQCKKYAGMTSDSANERLKG